MRSPYTEHAASGLPNPTHLEGEVRFVYAQNQQLTTRNEIVTECLLILDHSTQVRAFAHKISGFTVCDVYDQTKTRPSNEPQI